MALYDSDEALLAEIEAGEDAHLDFKEVVWQGREIRFAGGEGRAAQELAKDLCCFANTDGGVILFGVRRDGERLGLPAEGTEALQQFIVNVAQNSVEPPLGDLLLVDRLVLPDRDGVARVLLKVEVRRASLSLHAPLGRRPYHRLGDHCFEMTMEQQARALERRGMMAAFEERPLFRADPAAIDRQRFAAYCQRRYGEDTDGLLATDELLVNLRLAGRDEGGGLHPTALGVLLFATDPDAHLPGAFVDIAAYHGDVPDAAVQRDAKTIRGPLPDQLEQALTYLKTSPLLPVAATKDGSGRLDRPAYSLRAVQEAVVNALVHRDYGIRGAQVRILLFPDRIEISNPGRLHNTLTVQALFAGCQPVRRNQMLAGFLREYRSPITGRAYMEGRGEGFLSMVRECREVSGRPPRLEIIADSVRLTIWGAAPA